MRSTLSAQAVLEASPITSIPETPGVAKMGAKGSQVVVRSTLQAKCKMSGVD